MINSTKHLPKNANILTGLISDSDISNLRNFINEKVADNDASINLRYRPDEWDSTGVIQKVYDLIKEYLKENYEIQGQLEPRKFTIRRILDASDIGEEYGDYDANGEILYSATFSIPGLDGCSGGETTYLKYDCTVKPDDTAILIHRCEANNDWRTNRIGDGSRLDLVILFQEISREISYDFDIDQIIENIPNF
jgi:hypothetical protein